MPNHYFRFQQFTVRQQVSAMKVCTDACLFGAWVARQFEERELQMLDIGTGTGLLSLIISQKVGGDIDAVEIDAGASEEAAANFRASPWHSRLKVFHTAIQQFEPDKYYDLIFSNPPFYHQDLKPEHEQRKMAMHNETLSLATLFTRVKDLLNESGVFALLIAERMSAAAEKISADCGLFITHKINVKQTPAHTIFRVMYLVQKKPTVYSGQQELVIRDNDNRYSADFSELLNDYYLSKKDFQ